MQYGRLPHDITTILDDYNNECNTYKSNATSLARVHYDYHGKSDDGHHAVDAWETAVTIV